MSFYDFILKMSQIKKQQVFKNLENLKSIVEIPKLYLANFFQDLSNNGDCEMFSKQILLNTDNDDINELNRIW